MTPAETSVSIPKGKTYMLDFDIDAIDFHEVITTKSSNTAVATVDKTGKITAVAPGTATIKIIVGNASASCKVTVTQAVNKSQPTAPPPVTRSSHTEPAPGEPSGTEPTGQTGAEQLEWPYLIPGTDLVILQVSPYDGMLLEELAAGASQQIRPSHFLAGMSRIVMIKTYDTAQLERTERT